MEFNGIARWLISFFIVKNFVLKFCLNYFLLVRKKEIFSNRLLNFDFPELRFKETELISRVKNEYDSYNYKKPLKGFPDSDSIYGNTEYSSY